MLFCIHTHWKVITTTHPTVVGVGAGIGRQTIFGRLGTAVIYPTVGKHFGILRTRMTIPLSIGAWLLF